MDISNEGRRLRSSRRHLFAVAVVAVALLVGVGLVIERIAGYSITGNPLPHGPSATTPNLVGAPPQPDSGSVAPPASRPPLSLAPIPGITRSAILAKLPASWGITTLTPSTKNDFAYVATTSTVIPGTQLRAVVGMSSPGSDEVSSIQCQFSRQSISIDSRLLAAARSCVNTVVPTDDQRAAAQWIDANAPALQTGAKRSEQLHDLQIGLQHMAGTFVVLANTPIL